MDLSLIKQFYYQLLPELRPSDWNWLAERFTTRNIVKGDMVVQEGQICRQVTFVNQGLFSFYINTDGKEIVTSFIKEGEYISDYPSFVLQRPGISNLRALEDSVVIELNYDTIQQAYNTIPAYQKFGRLMAEFLIIMIDEHTLYKLTTTPEERYKKMLEDSSDLLQRVPQYLIASYIGITPEALSRIRKRITEMERLPLSP